MQRMLGENPTVPRAVRTCESLGVEGGGGGGGGMVRLGID